MRKVKTKVTSDETVKLCSIRKPISGKKVRQKWNHIFKRIYMKNIKSNNRNDQVGENETPVDIQEKPISVKLNGNGIITDPIPSTSTGITANGRGKRKWEEIQQNMILKRKLQRMNGHLTHTGDSDSSLDDSDLAMNGEYDLSSDVNYEDSESGMSSNDIADLMAMHEMENGLGSDYDEYGEFCSEEESLDEEYSVEEEDQSYDSNEIESEYYSPTDEEYSDEELDEEEDYHLYEGTSSDTDYDPGSDFVEDLYVERGAAVVYSAKEITNVLPFTEDSNEPQVIDVTDFLEVKSDNSSDSCPKLVPIKGQKINGKSSSVSSSDTSATSEDVPIVDDDFSSDVDSVHSVKDSSSESGIEDILNIDTQDDFFLSNSVNNNSPSCLLHLKRPIYVNGVVDVELLSGNAQIFGYKLPRKGSKSQTKAQIISARGYKLINITPMESFSTQGVLDVMKSLSNIFPSDDLSHISITFKPESHALLLLTRSNLTTKVKIVKKYTTGRYLFPESMTIGQRTSHYVSEAILNTKIYPESICKRPLKLLPEWEKIVLEPNSRTLLVGGKNVGKSTCIEYLINKTLHSSEKILLIDLDIGQPILFVPQVVSAVLVDAPILGNGVLSEHRTILKSFMFGDINVMLSPVKYVKCVKKLLEFCFAQENLRNIPWVINTMGFQKGLGVELMAAFIRMTNPTKVVQIQHQIENFNFRHVMNDTFVNNFTFNMFKKEIEDCELPRVNYDLVELCSAMNDDQSKSQEDPSLLPVEKRTVMILAHLADIPGECEWITDAIPFVIINPRIYAASSEKIPKNRELETINGNIVYLCHSHTSNTSDLEILECLGLGIVRAIDIKHNLAYVHHSISRDKMYEVNLLVLANITPPKDIFLKQSTKVKGPLPNLYNTEAEFAGSRKINRGNNSQYVNN